MSMATLAGYKEGVAATFADVIKSKYLLLTTFTKDGRPKPTAIPGVPEDGKLLVITDDGSWKTKRIKNTPRVTIAKSGSLGKPKSDDVEASPRFCRNPRPVGSTTRSSSGTGITPRGSTCTQSCGVESTRFTWAWRSRRRLVSQASQRLRAAVIGAL